MLAETLDEWAAEKYRLGQAEGMKRGRSKGRVEGERELLRRQAERRFGADVAEALSKLIEGLDAPDRLAEVGDLVVDCATGVEQLFELGGIDQPQPQGPAGKAPNLPQSRQGGRFSAHHFHGFGARLRVGDGGAEATGEGERQQARTMVPCLRLHGGLGNGSLDKVAHLRSHSIAVTSGG